MGPVGSIRNPATGGGPVRRPLIVIALVAAGAVGCRPGGEPGHQPAPADSTSPADDLASARKGFVTRLRIRGPAPQGYRNDTPPAGVKQVEYTSGGLKLKGWLSAGNGEGKKRSA